MNKEERVQFYLGSNKDKRHRDMNKYAITDLTNNENKYDLLYDVPLKKLLINNGYTKKRFCFSRGDVIAEQDQNNWSLSKNRGEKNTDSVLLRSFNFDRHWLKYYTKPKEPIAKFSDKKSALFWRGTTTGCSQNFNATIWEPRTVNRFNLIEKWFNKHPNIDIGFSFIHRDWLKKKYQRFVKGICRIEDFLKYKYILSVEGNDKDSGLNWKLNSNSVVFMAKPRVTSWLMETTLVPDYHYVLLKDDFSDLLEKIEWCNNNQNKCIEIIKNANNFMSQFADNKTEMEIESTVLKQYFLLKDKLS
jgi:hypothetical protein